MCSLLDGGKKTWAIVSLKNPYRAKSYLQSLIVMNVVSFTEEVNDDHMEIPRRIAHSQKIAERCKRSTQNLPLEDITGGCNDCVYLHFSRIIRDNIILCLTMSAALEMLYGVQEGSIER